MATDTFSKLPSDIVLRILEHVETSDIQSLVETNRSTREVSSYSKALWIMHATEQLRRRRGLDLPSAQSFSEYEVSRLRSAVCRSARVDKNWNGDSPKYLSPLKSYSPSSEIHDKEKIAFIWCIFSGCALLYTEEGMLRLFNFKTDRVIGEVAHRKGIFMRDFKLQWNGDAVQILCLIEKDPDYNDKQEDAKDEPKYNYILLRVDVPSINTSYPQDLIAEELCKFQCEGDFVSGGFLSNTEELLYIVTKWDAFVDIHFTSDFRTGLIYSKELNTNNDLNAIILARSPIDDTIFLYDIYPNKRIDKTVEIVYKDSADDGTRVIDKVRSRMKSRFIWDESEGSNYPIELKDFDDPFECKRIFRNVLHCKCAQVTEDLKSLTSITLLVDVAFRGGKGYKLDKDTSWILMQHYASITGPFGKVCIAQMMSPVTNSDGPVVAVSFNHAAWVETDEYYQPRALRLASFARATLVDNNGFEHIGYNEPHVVSLELPKEDQNGDRCFLLYDIQDIVINETRGTILLLADNKLYTVHYA